MPSWIDERFTLGLALAGILLESTILVWWLLWHGRRIAKLERTPARVSECTERLILDSAELMQSALDLLKPGEYSWVSAEDHLQARKEHSPFCECRLCTRCCGGVCFSSQPCYWCKQERELKRHETVARNDQ